MENVRRITSQKLFNNKNSFHVELKVSFTISKHRAEYRMRRCFYQKWKMRQKDPNDTAVQKLGDKLS